MSRAVRWFVPAALLSLAPKCLLCALAYAGLGAALGLGGPEICGASAGVAPDHLAWLAVLGVTSCTVVLWFTARRRTAGGNPARSGRARVDR